LINYFLYFLKDDQLSASSLWLTRANNKTCPSIQDVTPSRYLNPIIYTRTNLHQNEQHKSLVLFQLNLNLIPSISYFCDIVSNNNTSSSLKRVTAKYVRANVLQCDFMPLKSRLEHMIALAPIQQKFLNLTLEIRAIDTRLLASTNLYAFNCTHFTECSQCLSPRLGSSCIWCAANSRCTFVKETILSRKSIITRANGYLDTECPNEIEYYQSMDVCTSMQVVNRENANKSKKRIEVAYAADTKLADLLHLTIKNRHLNYQTKFKCVFTKNQSTLNNDILLSSYSTALKWGSAHTMPFNFNKSMEDNADQNLNSFDCIYSPYGGGGGTWLNKHLDSQRVYFSVWWSTNQEKWTQVKIENDYRDRLLMNLPSSKVI